MGRERRSLFVAVDGPKHVGKTTVLDLMIPLLIASGLSVLRTKEPSDAFDLTQEECRSGVALARLIAEDRSRHLEATVIPGLSVNDVVISDRYIASSLVFQVLDGVPHEQVWGMNRGFRLPDLNIFLTADRATIHRRLGARSILTRFDRNQHTDREINQYMIVQSFLAEQGVRTALVDNSDGTQPVETAAAMAAPIINQICRRS